MKKYVVYHLEERGDAESGPLGFDHIEDGAFNSMGEATDFISKQKHPNWYKIIEVTDYPDLEDI